MEQRTEQGIVLDSCVVIDLIRNRERACALRASLRGKPARLVLCDVVLGEVRRVCGLGPSEIASRIAQVVRKGVVVQGTGEEHRQYAESVTEQYRFCHDGDTSSWRCAMQGTLCC